MSNKNNTLFREVVVKSTTANLSKIREFMKETAHECGFSDDVIGKIILAVDEACTNIIKHAYKYSPEGNIHISIKFADTKFEISITDEGLHFNPVMVPEPDIQEYYKQKKVGGLGVFLIKKLMDEVTYHTLTGNKNQVVLVKYLNR